MARALSNNLLLESDSSDTDDQILEDLYRQTRKAKKFRRRPNNFGEWEDEEFFMRFRITKPTALFVLDLIYEQLEYTTDRNQSLSPINQLLLALRYYATGGTLTSVGDFSGVHKTTAGRVIKVVSEAIAGLRPRFIKLPQNAAELAYIAQGFYTISTFPRVLGSLDCTHVRITSPGGVAPEEFRNRKGYFSFNVQTVSDSTLKIIDIVARWPGSSHDSTIYNNSVLKARLERGDFQNYVLLGDSGYANSMHLLTPLRNPRTQSENLYNEAQIRTRNTVERQYGVLKNRFPVLALGMKLKVQNVQPVIVACAVLHNIAISMKEENPPLDPAFEDVLAIAVEEGNINIAAFQENEADAVRQSFVNYFSGLL